MSRNEARISQDDIPAFNYGFHEGWDALMAEIRPLVADLDTINIKPKTFGYGSHNAAVERLRELVREGE